jgi:hypothetical protein
MTRTLFLFISCTITYDMSMTRCGDSLLNVVMSPMGHKEQQGDNGVDGENQGDLEGRGPQAVPTRGRAEQC